MSIVYTAGYEGSDIDRFVRTLKLVGVSQLADLRAVAVSRKAGFSKTKLAARLADEGIEYAHFVDLGDPKPGRDAARSGDFDGFRQIYDAHLATGPARAALTELAVLARSMPTCLLCYERDPKECHRSMVAQELADAADLAPFHLFANDPERYVRHATKLPRFHPRESVAAA